MSRRNRLLMRAVRRHYRDDVGPMERWIRRTYRARLEIWEQMRKGPSFLETMRGR